MRARRYTNITASIISVTHSHTHCVNACDVHIELIDIINIIMRVCVCESIDLVCTIYLLSINICARVHI